MAQVLENWEPGGNRRNSRYPWNEWLDGQARRLTKGEDYFCQTQSFVVLTYITAKRKGMRVRVHRDQEGDSVVVQAERQEDYQETPQGLQEGEA